MKKMFLHPGRMLAAMGAFALLPLSAVLAADTNADSGSISAAAPGVSAPVQPGQPSPSAKLPYGAEDIVKLTRSQISEDIILNYVQNSGTSYNLSPSDVVTLKDQGVSDRVIKAMLDQRKKLAEVAAQTAPPPSPQAPLQSDPQSEPQTSAPAPTPSSPDAAPPVVTPPNAPLAQAVPPPSTAYVIPYPPATSAYYGYYAPYYYPYYYGYGGPVISFGFGYRGGWHGGWGHGGWGHGSWGHGGFHHR